MKFYIVWNKNNNSTWEIVGAKGFVPKNVLGEAPFDELANAPEEAQWLQIELVEDVNGNAREVFTVDQVKKDEVLASRDVKKVEDDLEKETEVAEKKDLEDQLEVILDNPATNLADVNKSINTLAKLVYKSLNLKKKKKAKSKKKA